MIDHVAGALGAARMLRTLPRPQVERVEEAIGGPPVQTRHRAEGSIPWRGNRNGGTSEGSTCYLEEKGRGVRNTGEQHKYT